jgi:hypothetical protein
MQDKGRPSPISIPQKSHWTLCKIWHSSLPIRSFSSASVIGDRLFVYGGQQLLQGILSDFHSLKLNPDKEYNWQKETVTNGPGHLARHAAVSYCDELYVHGGINQASKTVGKMFKFS